MAGIVGLYILKSITLEAPASVHLIHVDCIGQERSPETGHGQHAGG